MKLGQWGDLKSAARNLLSRNKFLSATSLSIAVHLTIAAVIIGMQVSPSEPKVFPEESYVDLGYQTFDEIPEIVEHKVEPREVPEPETVKEDRVPAQAQELQDQSSDVAGVQKEAPPIPAPQATSTAANVTDVPYYKVKPKYPKEALLQGLEGHVLFYIDIKEDGGVENIRVAGGEKLNIFETEARRAIAKWKYKPMMDPEKGNVAVANHMVRLDFKLVDVQ